MSTDTIYVGNLLFELTDEDELARAFESFGKIAQARIVTERNGRSRGLVYIFFVIQVHLVVVDIQQIQNIPKRKYFQCYQKKGRI